MPLIDSDIAALRARIDELQARQAVNDMIMTTVVLPITMAGLGEDIALDVIASMRTSFEISTSGLERSRCEHFALVVSDHINGLADRVERAVRGLTVASSANQ